MVLYTPLDYIDVFPETFTADKLVTRDGRSFYVRETDVGEQIVQLLSTNPQDFLEAEFTPGEILK